jgi:hypothetical protein
MPPNACKCGRGEREQDVREVAAAGGVEPIALIRWAKSPRRLAVDSCKVKHPECNVDVVGMQSLPGRSCDSG